MSHKKTIDIETDTDTDTNTNTNEDDDNDIDNDIKYTHKSQLAQELDDLLIITEKQIHKERKKHFSTLPLIEKYRPTRIEQILLDEYVNKIMERIIKTKELNHTIISGNPGIGKTTTARCLAKKLYGKYSKQYVLEINASDFRGKTVREQILNFFKKSVSVPEADKNNYPTYKIIIMDEADNMTEKAQNIISDIIADVNNDIRFIFTCNDSQQIIEAIQSVCDIIRYKRVDIKLISLRLEDICELEKIKYEKNGLDYIAEICEGDMRSALNILSHTSSNYDLITVDNISEIYIKPHRVVLKKIVKNCIKNKAYLSLKIANDLRKNGYNGYDIISGIFNVLKSEFCNDIDEENKYRINAVCCKTLLNISKGIDTEIQIFSCILNMIPPIIAIG
jgi:replication factor C subunit 2/4